jgi:outer membrane cobalamin receptor
MSSKHQTILIVAALLLVLAATSYSQQSSGTIIGRLHDMSPEVEPGVVVRLIEVSTHTALQDVKPELTGHFVFRNVPFATYDLRVLYESDVLATRRVTVNSAVPLAISIDSLQEFRTPEVLVTADHYGPDDSRLSSRTTFTATTVQTLAASVSNKRIESLLLSTPGVVPDEDGRLHVRGEDAQLQYVIDGIPVTGNMTRVYSSLFNSQLIKSVNVLTGSLNAEYGVATAGVLAITTKSGFDKQFFIDASAEGGPFNTRDAGVQVGGNIGGASAAYFAFNASTTDRYLDPITSGDPNHDAGSAENFFGKLHTMFGDKTDLQLLTSYNTTEFEIPNSLQRTPAQDQVQNFSDYLVGLRINTMVGESSLLSVLGYQHQSSAKVTSGGLMTLAPTEYARAIQENEKFFIGGDRRYTTTGGQIEFSARPDWFSNANNFKAGASVEVYPVHEQFSFAVTNPALSDTSVAGGDLRFRPYDITQGGRPFAVDQSKTGTRYSAYVQNQTMSGRWVLNAGLRIDDFNFLQNEFAISPRIGASYSFSDALALRASYNRIVMQAPLENILVSSSDEARQLTGAEQGLTPTSVRSEKAHVFELGAAYRLNEHVDLDLAGYGKLIDDFLVKVELGNSGVIFPVNLKQGFVAGGELRARFHDWNNLSGFMSVSTCASYGQKPDDGSSPIAAGLIFGEEGQNYNHPFAGEDKFPTEHNQLITAVLNVQYRQPGGLFAGLNGRFDSGLPFDLVGKDGKGLDPEQSRAELKRRGYSDSIIDLLTLQSDQPGSPDKSVAPHVVFDLLAGYDFSTSTSVPVRLTATVMNLLDSQFLYKFESSFGGTHFGYPRMVSVKVEVRM